MALYPLAEKFLLPESTSQPRIKPTLIVLHTNASTQTLESVYRYWQGAVTEAHFEIEIGGRTGQYIDTTTRADSNSAANSFMRNGVLCGAISIETSDLGNHGDPGYMKSWSDLNERQALENLVLWCCKTHGIPAVPAYADGRGGWVGIGYHAQVASWSNAAHICPGPGKIAEVPDLIASVARRLAVPVKGNTWDFLFMPAEQTTIARAGVKNVGRYILKTSGSINRPEVDIWHGLGVAVFLIAEFGGHAWADGVDAARSRGARARTAARALGWPDERPIVCADYDEYITPTSFPTCLAYQQAWAAGGGVGPQSAYGEGALLIYLKAHGALRFGFQSMSTSFPGNASISSATNLLQTTQKNYTPPFQPETYDEDYPITADFGQHPRPQGADDMSAEDVAAINAHTDQQIATLWTVNIKPFLTAMLRGDAVGQDVHDNESVEGANTKAAAARDAAQKANSQLDSQAVIIQQIADAVSSVGGLDGALVQAAVEEVIRRVHVGSVPGDLTVTPVA